MGDRVSVSFKNGDHESVTLYSHWGGREFAERAVQYVEQLKEDGLDPRRPAGVAHGPLDRLEPRTVMVDFIRTLTKGMDKVYEDLYLGATPADGDNSDNGHYTIDLEDGSYDVT
jgi:hypothetical protein